MCKIFRPEKNILGMQIHVRELGQPHNNLVAAKREPTLIRVRMSLSKMTDNIPFLNALNRTRGSKKNKIFS